MHPITSFLVIPVFALAHAGVRIDGDILSAAFESPVTWGIVVGLVVGKTVGITLLTLIATKVGIAKMPREMTLRHLIGLAMIAGIGFTVSIFVSNLAFGDAEHHGDEVAALFVEADDHDDDADSHDDDGTAHGNEAAADDGHAGDGPVGSSPIEDNAKIGILLASVLASLGGLLILSGAGERDAVRSRDPDD